MLPAGMLRPFFKRRELCRRRKEELRLQFKEAIQIVASALAAGYSVENAFIASVRDLEEQYGKEGMITREFSYLASQLKMIRPAGPDRLCRWGNPGGQWETAPSGQGGRRLAGPGAGQ